MKNYFFKLEGEVESLEQNGFKEMSSNGIIFFSHSLEPEIVTKISKVWRNSKNLSAYLNELTINKFLLFIVDTIDNQIFIVNDKFGSNQIYYFTDGVSLYVSDNPGKIFDAANVPVEINPTAVYELLSCLTIMPPRSIYKDINTVPMGTVVSLSSGGVVSSDRYWNLESYLDHKESDYDTHIDAVRKTFIFSLEKDYEEGLSIVTLSGGIDSGGILGIVSGLIESPVPSITVGGKGVDTTDLVEGSRRTVEYFNSKNTELYPNKLNLELFPKVLGNCHQPVIAHIVLAHTLMLTEAQKQGYKKIFYGYGTQMVLGNLTISKFAHYFGWLEKLVPKFILDTSYVLIANFKGYSANRKAFLLSDNWKDRFFYSHTALFTREKKIFSKLPENFKEEITRFLDPVLESNINIIDKLTAMYMLGWTNYGQQRDMEELCRQFSIEPISPYIDVKYAQEIMKTSNKFRRKNKWNKQVIREMLKPYIPEYLYKMQGRSLIVPYQRLVKGTEPYIIEYLKTSKIIKDHIDIEIYEKEFYSLPEPWLNMIRLLGLAVWYDTHHDPKNIENFDTAMQAIRNQST
jgi:asparagine synthetase B (glutamine-hydrolysing)